MTTGWSTAGFADVAQLVRERTGLVFPDARLRDVEATIRRTMARLGVHDSDALISQLRDDSVARDAFIAELTIGESYFQRDPAQFDLLRSRILPGLLAGRPVERPVRVWSAGCASGEEPYTVAMLFEELDAADRADIVGTDIARARLEDAQRAVYSAWQLRSTPEPVRRRYFAERGRYFELSPRIRQRVDFRYLNLAEDSFPSLTTGIWGMDVILCRNVLIYFDAPTIERVAGRLIASLSEDGWLLLGASDPAIGDIVDCDVVLSDSGLAYRRRGAAGTGDIRRPKDPHAQPVSVERDETTVVPVDQTPSTEGPDHPVAEPPILPVEPSPAPAAATLESGADAAIEDAYARRDFQRVSDLAEAAAGAGHVSAQAYTLWVRAQANEGRHGDAVETLTRATEDAGPTPELLYLHAVLLLQSGRPADAASSARRALYLDRDLIVAHLTLGEAQRRSGNIDGARRSLRNASALLASLAPSSPVPASDGETAGRLSELVRVKLELLGTS